MQKSAPAVGAHRPKTPILRQKSGVIEYYGYRDYDAASGRWTARDPISEQGGLNLYGMVGNDAVDFIDLLGEFQVRFDKSKITKFSIKPVEYRYPASTKLVKDDTVGLDEVGVYVSATGSWSLARSTQFGTVKDLVGKVLTGIDDCECVNKMQLLIHSDKNSLELGGVADDPSKQAKKELSKIDAAWRENYKNQGNNYQHADQVANIILLEQKFPHETIRLEDVKSVFGRFTKKNGKSIFCKECIIYMESCHLGLGPIPQEIANVTGCTVRAAKGFSAGRPLLPSLSRSRKNVAGHDDPYSAADFKINDILHNAISEDGYEFFPPKN